MRSGEDQGQQCKQQEDGVDDDVESNPVSDRDGGINNEPDDHSNGDALPCLQLPGSERIVRNEGEEDAPSRNGYTEETVDEGSYVCFVS